MESDPGEDDLSARGWDARKLTSEGAGSLTNLDDELNKSQTHLGYLDVDKELEAKQDLVNVI